MIHRLQAALALFLIPSISCTWGASCTRREPEAPAAVTPTPEPSPAPTAVETPPDLAEVPSESLPPLADDADTASLIEAIDRSLEYLGRTSRDQTAASLARNLDTLRSSLAAGEAIGANTLASFRALRPAAEVLATGYYEPVVDARLQRGGGFVHPVYRRPDDLVEIPLADFPDSGSRSKIFGRVIDGRLEPYSARSEIDGDGALRGRGLELAWLDDPIALFFLHIQGSGVLRLEDGSTRRIGYSASNGRSYTSIGRLLREDGSLRDGETSSPAIQRYLRAHPERRDEILFANERYIFFRDVADGPIGSLGVRLTAGRSIAADPSVYPPGSLAWISTRVPVIGDGGNVTGFRALERFVLVQDAGAAITGPGRIDLFFGTGEEAGLVAGNLAEPASLLVLE